MTGTKPVLQENKLWQKTEDVRLREDAVLRREETVQQREDGNLASSSEIERKEAEIRSLRGRLTKVEQERDSLLSEVRRGLRGRGGGREPGETQECGRLRCPRTPRRDAPYHFDRFA